MKYTSFFFLLFLQGCFLIKTTPEKIRNTNYVCDKGQMVGNTTILFKDSTFIYFERGGLSQGEGKWELSSDFQYLLLTGSIDDTIFNKRIIKSIELKLSIKKNAKMLEGDGCVFLKKMN